MAVRHRVVLVREWDTQLGGSGCCGRLGGLDAELGCDDQAFAHVRRRMEAMGAVYRALLDAFGDERIELIVADPRNTAWLVPAILRDARRGGMGWRAALAQVRDGVGTGSIVVDGTVVHHGGLPSPEAAVAAVGDQIAAPTR